MPYVQVLVHVVGGGVDILLVMSIAFYRVSFHSFLLLFFFWFLATSGCLPFGHYQILDAERRDQILALKPLKPKF